MKIEHYFGEWVTFYRFRTLLWQHGILGKHVKRIQDDELKRVIDRVLSGEKDYFSCIVKSYYEDVFRQVCWKIPHHDAEIVVQTVFINVFKALMAL